MTTWTLILILAAGSNAATTISINDIKSLSECQRIYAVIDARAIEAAVLAKLREQSEPVYYEFRWLDTNEHTVTTGQWSEWEKVEARGRNYTVQDRLDELNYYIGRGNKYEIRKLYTHPPVPSVPEGYQLVPVDLLDAFPEINPSNYDHDDACRLNAWGVELVLAAKESEK